MSNLSTLWEYVEGAKKRLIAAMRNPTVSDNEIEKKRISLHNAYYLYRLAGGTKKLL